ncbi:hypothetical protein V490_05133 [Pseudogymnoascus sp. VKM F-3557]|nr:hypothetical protein V490_05133 [Pseudogymnoascus sp. VKM F-3557]
MATNPDPNTSAERAPPPPLLPADSTTAQPDASTTYTPDEKEDLMTAISARRSDRTTSARLSLPTPQRLLLGTSTAFLVGLTLGGTHGFGTAGLRFRAENAHRLPKDPTGWYLYHKSKNYRMMLDGVREGVRMGGRVAVWTLVFLGTEEVWDNVRGRRDVGNTVIASATVAGGFSLWNRFPMATAARTAKTGLAIGLAYGLAQDAVGAMRGRRPGYVDFILGSGGKEEGVTT